MPPNPAAAENADLTEPGSVAELCRRLCHRLREQDQDVVAELHTLKIPVAFSFPEINPRPLFFIHIPKTAGASLNQFLEGQFDDAEVCPGWNPHDLAEIGTRAKTFRLFRGHFTAGQALLAPPDTELFTILREPGAQMHSMYMWLRRLDQNYWKTANSAASQRQVELATNRSSKNDQRLAEHGMKLARALRFPAFLKTESSFMNMFIGNMTIYLSNSGAVGYHFRRFHEKFLTSARKNFSRCLVTGTFERLNQSLNILCWRRGWAAPTALPKTHFFRGRQVFRAIDARSKALITQKARFDKQFHIKARTNIQNDWMQLNAAAKNNVTDYLDTLHRERFFASTSPVFAVDISADKAWPGTGWGLRERNQHGQVWRWLGYAGRSTLLAKLLPDTSYLVTALIHTAVDMATLNSLCAAVAGESLQPVDDSPQSVYAARRWLLSRDAVIRCGGSVIIEFSAVKQPAVNAIAFARLIIHPW